MSALVLGYHAGPLFYKTTPSAWRLYLHGGVVIRYPFVVSLSYHELALRRARGERVERQSSAGLSGRSLTPYLADDRLALLWLLLTLLSKPNCLGTLPRHPGVVATV